MSIDEIPRVRPPATPERDQVEAGEEDASAQYGAELSKEDFKFSSAHFTLFGSQKAEGLHGHNYRVGVHFWGSALNELGFLADFAAVKIAIRRLCTEWDEKILLPTAAPFLRLVEDGEAMGVEYAQRRYRLPLDEMELLPISNITVEALARLFWRRLAVEDCWSQTHVNRLRVTIFETSGQGASFTSRLTRPRDLPSAGAPNRE